MIVLKVWHCNVLVLKIIVPTPRAGPRVEMGMLGLIVIKYKLYYAHSDWFPAMFASGYVNLHKREQIL